MQEIEGRVAGEMSSNRGEEMEPSVPMEGLVYAGAWTVYLR